MTTQPQPVVMVSTPIPQRSVMALGVEFRFVRCNRRHLFGLTDYWVTKQEKVRLSDLERTIIDGLKQPGHCGGVTDVAKGLWMRRQDVNVDRLVRYATRIGAEAAGCSGSPDHVEPHSQRIRDVGNLLACASMEPRGFRRTLRQGGFSRG